MKPDPTEPYTWLVHIFNTNPSLISLLLIPFAFESTKIFCRVVKQERKKDWVSELATEPIETRFIVHYGGESSNCHIRSHRPKTTYNRPSRNWKRKWAHSLLCNKSAVKYIQRWSLFSFFLMWQPMQGHSIIFPFFIIFFTFISLLLLFTNMWSIVHQ